MQQRCSKYFTRRTRPHGHVTYQIKGMGHVHACIHMCVHACMHAWEYENLGACTCVFICTLMCVRMHACMYIFAKSLHKY